MSDLAIDKEQEEVEWSYIEYELYYESLFATAKWPKEK